MIFKENQSVQAKINSYPAAVGKDLLALRQLIVDTAQEQAGVAQLEETFKWGEPSYLCKGGSTIRIDYKDKTPDCYYMFFICSTKLIETFRELYGDVMTFEGNRAIVLTIGQPLPERELKHCISLALNYQHIKDLPLLGA